MSDTRDLDITNNVCEWITITAPESIHYASSQSNQLWRTVLRALIDLKRCDGVQECDWSRVLEQPSELYLWISWTHKSAYDAHVDMDRHRHFHQKLELLSSSVVKTKIIQYDMPGCYSGGARLARSWPSVTLMQFPGKLTEKQRDQIESSPSMAMCTERHNPFIDQRKLGGFVLLESDSHGELVTLGQDTYVMLDRWESPAREEEVKGIGKPRKHRAPARERCDRAQSPPPRFVEQMRALGCSTIETRHMRFTHMHAPTDPHEVIELVAEDMEAKSFEFDWEKGRKMWKKRKRARMSRMRYGCRCGTLTTESEAAIKRQMLLAEDRDVDAERGDRRNGLRANAQLKLRRRDYKGMC